MSRQKDYMGLKFALLKAERAIFPIGTLHVTLTLKYAFRMIKRVCDRAFDMTWDIT